MPRRARAAVLLALGLLSALTSCRACAPTPPASHARPDAGGAAVPERARDPDVAVVAVARPDPATALGVDAGPPETGGPRSAALAALRALEAPLVGGTAPISELLRGQPAAERPGLESAMTDYVRCMAVVDPQSCRRLAPERAEYCEIDAAQVAARARGPRGWLLPPPVLARCLRTGATESDCARYAGAIETSDPALCAGLSGVLATCAALASGDPARCGAGDEREACERQVAAYAALRRGAAEAPGDGDASRGAYARGTRGAAACLQGYRDQIAQPGGVAGESRDEGEGARGRDAGAGD